MNTERWPSLAYDEWDDTYATLHRWTQIVGKIRLKQMPWINHSWHVTLYPTSRGLTTSPMQHGDRTFQIDFDFIAHRLLISSSDSTGATVELRPRSVADFYTEVFEKMNQLNLPVQIYARPNELEDDTPFYEDQAHASYDAEYAARWWRIAAQSACVLQEFRARFLGKSSPVHFFWGSFDLAVTRFSGRRAPPHPGGVPHLPDRVAREAYSHEVSSCGFWPGGAGARFPAFYAYAYPEPAEFASAAVQPEGASYHTGLREFILPYDDMRRSRSPDDTLLAFAQTTYEAATALGRWDRASLERREEAGRGTETRSTPGGISPLGRSKMGPC